MIKDERLQPSYDVFEKLLGSQCSSQLDGQVIEFKLAEVSRLTPATPETESGSQQAAFSLLFKEVSDFQPAQRIFTINTDLGHIDLFMVQVGPGEYEAIFN